MSEGYRFVSLPDRVHRSRREQARHDKRVAGTYAGVIEVTYLVEQPVHVGAGLKALVGDRIVRRAARVVGRPGVPGASMKGVLRARYEAITRSCASAPPEGGYVTSETFGDVEVTFTRDALDLDVFRACAKNDLCAACALFGRMSLRSRITVLDFEADSSPMIVPLREQFSPRAHHLGRFTPKQGSRGTYLEVSSLEGRKFACEEGPVAAHAALQQVEAIPAGAHLRGGLRVQNLRPEEMGGLLAALGKEPSSALKVGAGKGQRLGRIRLEAITLHLVDAARAPVTPDLAAWRRAFEASPDRWAMGEHELVRIHQGDC